jgi:hypothetical protein
MQIVAARESARVHLRPRADHHHAAIGVVFREPRDEVVVDPFIDDADVSVNRAREFYDICRHQGGWIECLAKMLNVDSAAERIAVRVVADLVFPDFRAARKDDIRNREELAFAPNQFGGRAAKLRELVHAIVNDRSLVQMTGEGGDGHRIVKPLHRVLKIDPKRTGQD